MNDKLRIVIPIKFNIEQAKQNMQKFIKDIEKEGKIRIDIDDKTLIETEEIMNQLEKSLKDLNKVSIKSVDGKTVQVATEFKDELGKTLKVINDIAKNKITVVDTKSMSQIDKANKKIELFQLNMKKASAELRSQFSEVVDEKALLYLDSASESLNKSTPELEHKMKLLNIGIKEVTKSAREASKGLQQMDKASKDLEAFLADMQINIDSLERDPLHDPVRLDSFKEHISEFSKSMPDLKHNMRMARVEMRSMKSDTSVLGKEAQRAGKFYSIFGQSIFEAGKKFASWLFIGNIIMQTVRGIRYGVQAVGLLDKEMTSLRKVSEGTNQEYRDFIKTANEVGRTLGKLTTEVVNSAAEFARLGYNIQQSATLAREALLMSNVGEMEIQDATTALISIVKGFGVEIDDQGKNIRKVLDTINEVANNFAVSQVGIAEALKRSSATLQLAGNTIEESIAMVTAANAVLQDPSTIGTAMKAISMRIRGVAEDGERLGDLVPKLESSFASIGLTLKRNNNTFKSTYEIFDDLANVWESLSDMKRAEILELVAGKQRGQVVGAMLSNWSDAIASLEAGLNSAGSAAREFEKYMDSMEYKSERLSNIFAGIFEQGIDPTLFKDAIDSLTVLVFLLSKLTDAIGLLPSAFIIVGGSVAIFNQGFRDLLISMSATGTQIGVLTVKLRALGVSARVATVAIKTLQVASGLIVFAALGFVLEKLMSLFGGFADGLTETTDQQLDHIEMLRSNIDRVEELTNKLNDSNLSLKEQRDIQAQLASILPEATTGYDEQGRALATNLELIEKLNKEEEKQLQAKAFSVIGELGTSKDLKNYIKIAKDAQKEMDILSEQIIAYERMKANMNLSDMQEGEVAKAIQNLSKEHEKLNETYKDACKKANLLNNAHKVLNNTTDSTFIVFENINEEIAKFSSEADNVKDSVNDLNANVDDLNANIPNLIERYKEASAELEVLNKFLEDYNKSNKLSDDQMMELLKTYPELIDAFSVEEGQIRINIDAVNELRERKRNAFKESISDKIEETNIVNEQTRERLRAYRIEGEAIEELVNETKKKLTVQQMILTAIKDHGSNPIGVKTREQVLSEAKELEEILKSLEDGAKFKQKMESLLKALGSGISGASSSASYSKESTYAINEYSNALEKLDLLIKQSEGRMSKLTEESSKYRDELKVQLGLLKEKQQLVENEASSIRKQLEVESLSIEQKDKLGQELRRLSGFWWDIEHAIDGVIDKMGNYEEILRKDWIKQQNEILKRQREDLQSLEQLQEAVVNIIRKRGEEERKILEDSHKKEMELLEEVYRDKKEKYKQELDDFKAMIQGKIDALEEQYAEEDYLEELGKEKEKAIEIQKEIDVLSLDDSLVARNKLVDLRKKLAEQNEKITKMQQKKERDEVKKSLQSQLKNYEENAQSKEKILDDEYNYNKDVLERQHREEKEHLEEAYSDAKVYAEARQAILRNEVEVTKGHFMSLQNAFEDFEDKFGKGMGILGQIIKDDFIDTLKQAQRAINELTDASGNIVRPRSDYGDDYLPGASDPGWVDNDAKINAILSEMTQNSQDWWKPGADKNALEQRNQELGRELGKLGVVANYDSHTGKWNVLKYKYGGKIDYTGIAEVHGSKSEPEYVFNYDQFKDLAKLVAGYGGSRSGLPSLNIGSLIRVEGSVTKESIPLIEEAGKKVMSNLQKILNKNGVFRPVQFA